MKKSILVLFLLFLMVTAFAVADELSLGEVNSFLNGSAKLGEGSKANQVAVIPFNHIDGPKEEDLFYAFVPFKYVARNYIKYQVTFISCTCRSADVNLWSTAYVELTLPSSGKIEDSEVRTLSFDLDSTGHYLGGFWGDSNPPPTAPEATYEDVKAGQIPVYIGKTCADIMKVSTVDEIEGIDVKTGATVSANNILRMLQAIYAYHATDAFFDGDATAATLRAAFEDKKATAETTFGPTCSAINSENLKTYLGRTDVMYIDLRDYADYAKKHLRNFECIPYFALIFNADAHTDASLPQLFGGSVEEPVPVYEESDEILEAFFPKNKTIFLMCQSGGRVNQLMKLLNARGWDMTRIYNIGGMAQYAGPEYRDLVTDTPEILVEATYHFEGLTRK